MQSLFKLLSLSKFFLLIFIVGFIVYFNALFNGFAFDDFPQVVDNPYVHSLEYVYKIFSGPTFNYGASSELSGAYYKPIMSAMFAVIYTIFGEKAFFFHLFQLSVHIFNSIFIYLLLKNFIKRNISFFLSLVFLVHPINVEAVSYISALQDALYLFFGIIAFFIAKNKEKGLIRNIFLIVLLILSILSKETGFLFLPIIFIYQFLFDKKKNRIFVFLSIIPIGLYLLMRLIIAEVHFQTPQLAPITYFSLGERLLNIPYIFYFYLKTFIFPSNLIAVHFEAYKILDFGIFFLPLIVVIVFSSLVILEAKNLFHENKKQFNYFLFFSLWFFLGIGLHFQIFPLDMTVADRWFYFPMVGLLGMIGVVLSNLKINKKILIYFGILLSIAIIFIFSFRTIARNSNWKDSLSLFTHDIKVQKDNFELQALMGYELNKVGKYDQAIDYLEKSLKSYIQSPVLNNLGTAYARKGDIEKALEYLRRALKVEEDESIRQNISYLLINNKESAEAEKFIEESLVVFPSNPVLWIYLAIVKNRMGNISVAKTAAQQCFNLSGNEKCFSYDSYKNIKL
ncbi:MAG: tetratricopeptide repeat protein [Candidatus Levybacteria bacterium]|nr:tetratricopeptide repeat protein [Candidatus Levybacteria bacterium]